MTEAKRKRLQDESAARAPQQAAATARAQEQQEARAQLATAPEPKPTATILLTDDGITAIRPRIKLRDYILLGNGKQFDHLNPGVAVIRHGVVYIDEMKLVIPLAGVSYIEPDVTRKD